MKFNGTKTVFLWIFSVLAFCILFFVFFGFPYNKISYEKLTLAPPLKNISCLGSQSFNRTEINDASRLNSTVVVAFQPKTIQEIKQLIELAKSTNQNISLSGARHSLGGQNLYINSIHLNMTHYDQVHYNEKDQSLTIQSGATWKQAQEALGKHGRAIRVMQDSNIFTIGGSLSLNIHGKDPRFGSLIESINWFKIITANGKEIVCSRKENSELFRSVIGGLGLYGVITEVNLKTINNSIYKSEVINAHETNLLDIFEKELQDKNVELIEAQMSVDRDSLMREAQLFVFRKTQKPKFKIKDDISAESNIWLRRIVYLISRQSNFGKEFRWFIQKTFARFLDPPLLTRNSAMSAPFRMLELKDTKSTDILQEYFVPKSKVNDFISVYRSLLLKHKIQIVNITVRKVKKDNEALISYATDEMYGFVSYYTVPMSSQKNIPVMKFTQELTDYLVKIHGNVYLAYKGYYSFEQLNKMYPEMTEVKRLKNKYDPNNLFMNSWYTEFSQNP